MPGEFNHSSEGDKIVLTKNMELEIDAAGIQGLGKRLYELEEKFDPGDGRKWEELADSERSYHCALVDCLLSELPYYNVILRRA